MEYFQHTRDPVLGLRMCVAGRSGLMLLAEPARLCVLITGRLVKLDGAVVEEFETGSDAAPEDDVYVLTVNKTKRRLNKNR